MKKNHSTSVMPFKIGKSVVHAVPCHFCFLHGFFLAFIDEL